jgi:hypothetical protein
MQHSLRRDLTAARVATCRLEVHGHARRQRGDALICASIRAWHELDVNVAGEPVPNAGASEHGDQVVRDLCGRAGMLVVMNSPSHQPAAARRGRSERALPA